MSVGQRRTEIYRGKDWRRSNRLFTMCVTIELTQWSMLRVAFRQASRNTILAEVIGLLAGARHECRSGLESHHLMSVPLFGAQTEYSS